jgi:glucose/arabinose dehydrogenase
LVLWAVIPSVLACGGKGGGTTDDAAVVDAPGTVPDANPNAPDAAPQAACTPVAGTSIALQLAGTITDKDDPDALPVLVTAPPGDPRLFVVIRHGEIRILKDGKLLDKPFLDIDPLVNGGAAGDDEKGLLGLAFHPNYATNGKFYVYYIGTSTKTGFDVTDIIAEYTVSAANPDIASPTGKVLLTIDDPKGNHNGGMMEFGKDGKLWIGDGDGGEQGDPHQNAQNDALLLGKIFKLDVDADKPVPVIWAKGLRNPWRWSFDSATNDIYIGDVGQNAYEEISVTSANSASANFGWNAIEGTHPFKDGAPTPANPIPAASEKGHDAGWLAIIGGQVYRGACFPDLVGTYFYSDYNAKELWSLRWKAGTTTGDKKVLDLPSGPTSLHAGADGELYLTLADGRIMHLVAKKP